jgi:hypothetical protein
LHNLLLFKLKHALKHSLFALKHLKHLLFALMLSLFTLKISLCI